jgi:2-dehydro-3-deoxy-D-gluconate 5-dehydrogenase
MVMDKKISELLKLDNKVAIVTGGAQGIGFGIAQRLAEAGAHVVVSDLNKEVCEDAVSKIKEMGYKASSYILDVSNEDQVKTLIEHTSNEYGSLDILVNNAGIYPRIALANMTFDDFKKVLGVNLNSVFLTVKYSSEVMKKQGGGKIINISSIDALHPSMVGLAHYDASKHGVWGFTKNAALELSQYGITVNAVAPGGINTPGTHTDTPSEVSKEQLEAATKAFMNKIPMHRFGEPDDIGKVVLFLASDMASYMTGSQIVVDGGALLN